MNDSEAILRRGNGFSGKELAGADRWALNEKKDVAEDMRRGTIEGQALYTMRAGLCLLSALPMYDRKSKRRRRSDLSLLLISLFGHEFG